MTHQDDRTPIEPFRDPDEETPGEPGRDDGPAREEVIGAAAVTGGPIGSVEHGGAALAGFGAALGQEAEIAGDDDLAREVPSELDPNPDAGVAEAGSAGAGDDMTEVAGPDDPDA